jgi:hypothetical protein
VEKAYPGIIQTLSQKADDRTTFFTREALVAKRSSRKSDVPVQKLITLPSADLPETYRAANAIEGAGGQVMHIFGPRVIIGDVPGAVATAIGRARPSTRRAAEAPASAPAASSETEQLGIEAWNFRQSKAFVESKTERPRDGEPWSVRGSAYCPDGPGMCHAGETDVLGAPEAAAEDMSPFLIGSVAVGVIMVEGPTSNLQFSSDEKTKIVAEVQEGLTWLGTQEPRASITWSYDIHTVRVNVQPDPSLSGYEPMEAHWRNPAMAQLGFASNFQGVRDYVASIRNSLGTRWGYVAYFTKYPVNHFAYASKPRLVMHYDNDGWGPDNIDRVFTHETGHIFGCPDEYSGSACTCTARFGFLQEVNGNCENCASPFVPCLMAANTWAMCRFTPVHFGWRDSDNDGILDPIDSSVNPSINWHRLRRRFPSLGELLSDPAFEPMLTPNSPHEQVPIFLLRRVLNKSQLDDVEAMLAREEDEFLARLATRFGRILGEIQSASKPAKPAQTPKKKATKKRGRRK